MTRSRTPTDEVPTEFFDSGQFAGGSREAPTKVGRRRPEVDDDPTARNQEPIRVISMKTPAELEAEKREKLIPRAHIRPISAVLNVPSTDLGYLARPRVEAARSRGTMTKIGWGIAVIAIALVVAIALWFVMQRR